VLRTSPERSEALAAFNPKCPPRDNPRGPIPAGIQDEIRLKNQVSRYWRINRNPALKADVIRLQRLVTTRLNDWRKEHCGATLESLDSEDNSLWGMTKRMIRVPTPSHPGHPGGIALSDSEKAEALSEGMEPQFMPVTVPSVRAGIESRTALYSNQISNTFRGANQLGRHNSLSEGDPTQTTHLVASHRSVQEGNCSNDRLAGSSPEQEE
jgi:hypothetical protein